MNGLLKISADVQKSHKLFFTTCVVTSPFSSCHCIITTDAQGVRVHTTSNFSRKIPKPETPIRVLVLERRNNFCWLATCG